MTATFSQGIPPARHVPLDAHSAHLILSALKAHLATTWSLTRMESTWELSRLATLHVQLACLTPITVKLASLAGPSMEPNAFLAIMFKCGWSFQDQGPIRYQLIRVCQQTTWQQDWARLTGYCKHYVRVCQPLTTQESLKRIATLT